MMWVGLSSLAELRNPKNLIQTFIQRSPHHHASFYTAESQIYKAITYAPEASSLSLSRSHAMTIRVGKIKLSDSVFYFFIITNNVKPVQV